MAHRQNETSRASLPQHDKNSVDIRRIRRIAAGDADSLIDLYDHHATAMYSLALHILDRKSDATDVVCEVFADVWGEAGCDEASEGIVAVWLLILTRKRAINRLRVLRAAAPIARRTLRAGDGAARTALAREDRPDGTQTDAALKRVRDALLALSDMERNAIELAYFEGLGNKDVARRLEQPLDAVKTCIRGALLKLRAALSWEVR